jgi:hypothetical protein
MCRQVGSIVSISITTAVMAAAGDPGVAQAIVYGIAAAALLIAMPVIARVPEHRGAW